MSKILHAIGKNLLTIRIKKIIIINVNKKFSNHRDEKSLFLEKIHTI